MASFTDSVPQFKPYVDQLPVEAMVKVGMQKQAQYEQGVQKIQGQIDRVLGMDIANEADRAYTQSKLNELSNNLKFVAGGDFSNFQLVNSVGGMAGKVSGDKYVQAAVQSTARSKQESALMMDDRKKGKLTPANELHYSKQLNSYLTAGFKNEDGSPITFGGRYVPHFDVNKFIKETFDGLKIDGLSYDDVFEKDANGNIRVDAQTGKPIYSPTMTKLEKEGIFPEKAKETINQIFSDSRVSQQLSIDGQYVYRGLDGKMLSDKIIGQKNEQLKIYNDKLTLLTLDKNLGKDVQKQIDETQALITTIGTNYDKYAESAMTSPDFARGEIYKDDARNRFTDMYTNVKIKSSFLSNPGWEAEFKLNKEANDNVWRRLEYEQKEKKAKEEAEGKILQPTQANQPSNVSASAIFDADYSIIAKDFISSSDSFLWDAYFTQNPENIKKLNSLIDKGLSRNNAIATMLNNAATRDKQSPEEYRAMWGDQAVIAFNKMSPKDRETNKSLNDSHLIYLKARKKFDQMSSMKKRIDELEYSNTNLSFRKDALSQVSSQKITDRSGKTYDVSPEDMLDMITFSTMAGTNRSEADIRKSTELRRKLVQKGYGSFIDDNQHVPGGVIVIPPFEKNKAVRDEYAKLNTILSPNIEQLKKSDEIRSGIIKEIYGIKPNLNIGVLSGKVEDNREVINTLKNIASGYVDGKTQNEAGDFKAFSSSISGTKEDIFVKARAIIGIDGAPVIEIVSYDKDMKRTGGMVIREDEAKTLGIDINTLYEPPDISLLKNTISVKGGRSSNGAVDDKETYLKDDVALDKSDFPMLNNGDVDIKINFEYKNGMYYPHLWTSDGKSSKIMQLDGSADLNKLITTLKSTLTPAYVKLILIGK